MVDGAKGLVKGNDIEDCLVESVVKLPFVVDDCVINETVVVEAKPSVLADEGFSVAIKIDTDDWSVEDGILVVPDVELT